MSPGRWSPEVRRAHAALRKAAGQMLRAIAELSALAPPRPRKLRIARSKR